MRLLALLLLALLACGGAGTGTTVAEAAAAAADRQGAARRLAANGHQSGFQSACGSSEEVARKVGQCLVATLDMIEGRVPVPRGDEDLVANCERFSSTEKCIRQVAKDCLTGLPKTAVSTIPAAIRRFRNNECKSPDKRQKYAEPVKCAIKRAKGMQALYRNHTAIAQSIRDLPELQPEDKVMRICCLLVSMDREIERQFQNECPQETQTIISIVHAITDDARSTLCVAPKCQNALTKVIPARMKQQQQNFIEPIAQILFTLNTDG